MPEVVGILAFFPVEQHQPAVQVVGQHGDLKMILLLKSPRVHIDRRVKGENLRSHGSSLGTTANPTL